jgi:hypothetical protein
VLTHGQREKEVLDGEAGSTLVSKITLQSRGRERQRRISCDQINHWPPAPYGLARLTEGLHVHHYRSGKEEMER